MRSTTLTISSREHRRLMDPVSHVILARTIVAAFDKPDGSRFGRGVGAAGMLGGLSPDADSVLMPAGWDIYLRFHEIGTHSLFGALLIGCGAGALIRAFVRGSRNPAEGGNPAEAESHTHMSNPARAGSHISHIGGLAAAASLGAVSHLSLDALSGARLGLAWPVVNARATLPLVAMADPWLIGLLTVGAAALWLGRRQIPRAAIIVLLAVTAFLGIKGLFYARVRQTVSTDERFATGTARAFEARWGSWSTWNVFEKDARTLRAWRVNGLTGTSILVLSWPVQSESADVAASRSLDTVRNFLSVHDLAFAEDDQDQGRHAVLWSDVRYCRQAVPGAEHIDCALWFGGILDADGRPLTLVVHVGGWIQTRSISP